MTLKQKCIGKWPKLGVSRNRGHSLYTVLINISFVSWIKAITVEDFHSRLQEITNFPLRPFVIPFLKVNLPLLQNELLYFDQHPDLMSQQNNRFEISASTSEPKKRTTTDETSLSFGQERTHSQPNGQTSNPLAHLMLMNPQAQQYFADMFPYGADTAGIYSHHHGGQFGDIWIATERVCLFVCLFILKVTAKNKYKYR